jgi:GPH family glycoside/pentoside/hexuronide:cation symporter
MVSTGFKVPIKSKIGFGVGDFALNLVWQGTALFLLYFYTDILGISPGIAGLIYLTAMIWDAVTDPIAATIADRTWTRLGKYRPYIVFGALPFALSYPLAFTASPLGIIPVELWALFTHLLLRTTYTIVGVPFSSLQARLTDDAQERTVLAGFRMVGAASGGLTVVLVTPLFMRLFSEEDQALAFLSASTIAGVVIFLALLYCGLVMREPVTGKSEQSATLSQDIKSIGPMFLSNPPLIRLFAIIITSSICLGMFGKNIIYFFKYHLERPDLTVWALVTPAILLLLCVPFWVWLAGKRSKRDALILGGCIAGVGYVLFFLLAEFSLFWAFFSISVVGIGGSALPVMFWSMLPDTVEYGQAQTGRRAEAKIFGFATFAQKAAIGINALVLGLMLDFVGFVPNVAQSPYALLGIKATMTIVPAIGSAIIIMLALGYRLNQFEHAKLLKKIKN